MADKQRNLNNLKEMVPHLGVSVIETVLNAANGDVDKALDELLNFNMGEDVPVNPPPPQNNEPVFDLQRAMEEERLYFQQLDEARRQQKLEEERRDAEERRRREEEERRRGAEERERREREALLQLQEQQRIQDLVRLEEAKRREDESLRRAREEEQRRVEEQRLKAAAEEYRLKREQEEKERLRREVSDQRRQKEAEDEREALEAFKKQQRLKEMEEEFRRKEEELKRKEEELLQRQRAIERQREEEERARIEKEEQERKQREAEIKKEEENVPKEQLDKKIFLQSTLHLDPVVVIYFRQAQQNVHDSDDQNADKLKQIFISLGVNPLQIIVNDISSDYELASFLKSCYKDENIVYPFVVIHGKPVGNFNKIIELNNNGTLLQYLNTPDSIVDLNREGAAYVGQNVFDHCLDAAEYVISGVSTILWLPITIITWPFSNGKSSLSKQPMDVDIPVVHTNWYWRGLKRIFRFSSERIIRIHPSHNDVRASHPYTSIVAIHIIDANNMKIIYDSQGADYLTAEASDIILMKDIILRKNPSVIPFDRDN